MNWTPGPARCRSDEYEAEIAYTDMPGLRPFSGRVRQKGFSWMPADWTSDGRIYTDTECGRDLMPPTITREAAIDAGLDVWQCGKSIDDGMRAAVAAYRDAEIERLTAERDEARTNYQFMVNRAAAEKLAGYRELGKRAADAENERDALRAELDALKAEKAETESFVLASGVEDMKCRHGKTHSRIEDCLYCHIVELKATIARQREWIREAGHRLDCRSRSKYMVGGISFDVNVRPNGHEVSPPCSCGWVEHVEERD